MHPSLSSLPPTSVLAMFPSGESTTDTHHASTDVDFGDGQQDFQMPAASLASSGRGMDMAISRGHTHTRSFSHSPQAAYTPVSGAEFAAGHGHSQQVKVESDSVDFHGGYPDPYMLQQPETGPVDYGETSYPSATDNIDRTTMFAQSYHTDDAASISTPGEAQFAFGAHAEIYSTQSSPAYIQHEVPDRNDHHRFAHHRQLSGDYLNPHVHRHNETFYGEMPTHPSMHGPHVPPNYFGADSPDYPFRPPSPSTLFTAFGHHPPMGPPRPRRVPQMFKLSGRSKKHGGKKQPMACLFCRERKIGCRRPAEEAADQTCNQCARRDRECTYPSESRRGQHNRNRFIPRNSTMVDERRPPLMPPGQDSGMSSPASDGIDPQASR
ncbi:hypothetical protein DFH06DRAFT_1291695 [Mycena polygramma]|nr:hypothetical protein DFH06DRAFT_1291695 [Mycena polygramma]